MIAALEAKLTAEDYLAVGKLQKKWHKFWEKHGKPHPNSNDYLNMLRVFYYTEGLEAGYKIARRK